MKSITFTKGEFKEDKISAWLAGFIKFTQTIGAFDLLEQVKVKMKVIDYTIRQKMFTLLLPIVIGCRYTSDIGLHATKVRANIIVLNILAGINCYIMEFSRSDTAFDCKYFSKYDKQYI